MNKQALVLKSDRAGRVQTPVDQQIAVVREYERSGLSGPRFAALTGINYQTFVTWRRKHGVGSSPQTSQLGQQVPFVEAVISAGARGEPQGQAAVALVMELPSGVKLHLQCPAHIALAAQLVQTLNAASSC